MSLCTIPEIQKEISVTLKTSLTSVFLSLTKEVVCAIKDTGDRPENYHISIYPFEITRLDGNPISKELLLKIQRRLTYYSG
ncbi:MAG: hypothetical protein WC942_06570 [Clostridia bacterium]|jgi:hypothetical protein